MGGAASPAAHGAVGELPGAAPALPPAAPSPAAGATAGAVPTKCRAPAGAAAAATSSSEVEPTAADGTPPPPSLPPLPSLIPRPAHPSPSLRQPLDGTRIPITAGGLASLKRRRETSSSGGAFAALQDGELHDGTAVAVQKDAVPQSPVPSGSPRRHVSPARKSAAAHSPGRADDGPADAAQADEAQLPTPPASPPPAPKRYRPQSMGDAPPSAGGAADGVDGDSAPHTPRAATHHQLLPDPYTRSLKKLRRVLLQVPPSPPPLPMTGAGAATGPGGGDDTASEGGRLAGAGVARGRFRPPPQQLQQQPRRSSLDSSMATLLQQRQRGVRPATASERGGERATALHRRAATRVSVSAGGDGRKPAAGPLAESPALQVAAAAGDGEPPASPPSPVPFGAAATVLGAGTGRRHVLRDPNATSDALAAVAGFGSPRGGGNVGGGGGDGAAVVTVSDAADGAPAGAAPSERLLQPPPPPPHTPPHTPPVGELGGGSMALTAQESFILAHAARACTAADEDVHEAAPVRDATDGDAPPEHPSSTRSGGGGSSRRGSLRDHNSSTISGEHFGAVTVAADGSGGASGAAQT
jgi:hypothetical protein